MGIPNEAQKRPYRCDEAGLGKVKTIGETKGCLVRLTVMALAEFGWISEIGRGVTNHRPPAVTLTPSAPQAPWTDPPHIPQTLSTTSPVEACPDGNCHQSGRTAQPMAQLRLRARAASFLEMILETFAVSSQCVIVNAPSRRLLFQPHSASFTA